MEVSNNSNNSNKQNKEDTTISNSSSNNNNGTNSISKVPLRTRILQIFLSFSSVSEPLDPKVLFSELYYDYRPSEVFKVLNELVDEGIIAYKPDGTFIILSMSLPKVIKEILDLSYIASAEFLLEVIKAYKSYIRKGIDFKVDLKVSRIIWYHIGIYKYSNDTRWHSVYELKQRKILTDNGINSKLLEPILNYLNVDKEFLPTTD
jgi:hypothetical protein